MAKQTNMKNQLLEAANMALASAKKTEEIATRANDEATKTLEVANLRAAESKVDLAEAKKTC